MKPYF